MSDLLDLEKIKENIGRWSHRDVLETARELVEEVQRLRKAIEWTDKNKPSDGFTAGLRMMNLEKQIESLTEERDGLQIQFDAMIVFKNDWHGKFEKLEADLKSEQDAERK